MMDYDAALDIHSKTAIADHKFKWQALTLRLLNSERSQSPSAFLNS